MINVSVNTLTAKLPEKIENMCCEKSPDGWLCSLMKPHIGHFHVACLAVASVRDHNGSIKPASGIAILAVWDHA